MKNQKLFILCMACALASGTLFGATLIAGYVFDWVHSLSANSQKMIQPLLSLTAVVALGIAVYLRRLRGEPDE